MEAEARSRSWGIGVALVVSFLWGTTGTAATFAPEASPLAIGAAALGVGGLLQAVIALPSLLRAGRALRANIGLVLAGCFAVCVYPLAFYTSMNLAGVAVGSVVSLASAPLASGLLELFIDRKRLTGGWVTAAALGIGGSVLLCVSTGADGAGVGTSTPVGIALGLLAGVSYAVYSWVVQSLLGRGIRRAASMGAVFGGGGLLLMPVLFLTGAPLLQSPQAFGVAVYMAIVPMFLGYVLFGYALTKIPASTATTITLVEPAIATILAVVIVGERLTLPGWIGMALFIPVLVILARRGSADAGH